MNLMNSKLLVINMWFVQNNKTTELKLNKFWELFQIVEIKNISIKEDSLSGKLKNNFRIHIQKYYFRMSRIQKARNMICGLGALGGTVAIFATVLEQLYGDPEKNKLKSQLSSEKFAFFYSILFC